MDIPYAKVGEFAFLKVKQVADFGAFLDIGTGKDLLVPNSHQVDEMRMGKSYMVVVVQDKLSEKLIGSQKFKEHINRDTSKLTVGQEVEILVSHFTNLGANVIVDNEYAGLVYTNEIFSQIKEGDKLKAYIKALRPEGKIDIALQKQGVESIVDSTGLLTTYLKNHDGYAPLTDNSPPEMIYEHLGMSKKNFKKAVGNLYKQKLIEFINDGIKLVPQK